MTGNEVKDFRQRMGWSQLKLAREMGVAPTTIRRWEEGVSQPLPVYSDKFRFLMEAYATTEQA